MILGKISEVQVVVVWLWSFLIVVMRFPSCGFTSVWGLKGCLSVSALGGLRGYVCVWGWHAVTLLDILIGYKAPPLTERAETVTLTGTYDV